MSGGKSKSQTTTQQQQSTTDLPGWVTGPAQQAVQTATDLSQRPYSQYPGQEVADVPADTLQAYQQVRDMQGQTDPAFAQANAAYAGLLPSTAPITADQVNQTAGQLYSGYQQNVMQPAQGLLGGYLQGGPLTASQVGQNASALMSPYTSNVIDPANQMLQQQLGQNLGQIGAAANQSGAFGGSRQGVMEGVAQSQAALGSQKYLGDLLNNQWNNALSTGLSVGNLASTQGYNAASGLSNLAQAGYLPAMQAGQGIAGTNLQAGLTAAGAIPQLAVSQAGEAQKEASLLQTIGAAQQQQQQTGINQQIADFAAQQNWPIQNLDVLLSTLGGVPYGSTTASFGTSTGPAATKNTAAGVLGGAASGAALGSIVPGVGTAIGAVAGGILGAL